MHPLLIALQLKVSSYVSIKKLVQIIFLFYQFESNVIPKKKKIGKI